MADREMYVALLRGVMPSGRNRVPMAELRQRLAEAGFARVATYIQSGNVLLESELPPSEIERQIHEIIRHHFGGDLTVVVRTPAQLRAAFEGYPFEEVERGARYFVFLHSRPEAARVAALDGWAHGEERVAVRGEVAYLALPTGAARTRLTNDALERRLAVRATTRNFNTTRKLVELSGATDEGAPHGDG